MSAVFAIFAPEGAPAEYAGAAEGAGVIEFGGSISTLGGALTGYAAGGLLGAAKASAVSYVIGKINKAAAGLAASDGVSESNASVVSGLLDQASDGILEMEAECNVK